MKKIFTQLTLLAATVFLFTQCKKTEQFNSEPLEDYMPMAVGKYIIYRLDSMKFDNLDTIKSSYQVKDEVDGTLTDNLGRPSWRILRSYRNAAGTSPWVEQLTYMVTPTKESVEVIENNFRYIKLKLPINEGFNWKGNSYISLYSSDPDWDFRYLDDWDYIYENYGDGFSTLMGPVQNTVIVNQRDEVLGFPNDPQGFSERNFAYEVYGKGIGLIYKEFLHSTYQPITGSAPAYRVGYGIKLNMLSHN